jgi:YNFM family putative membrane transporter
MLRATTDPILREPAQSAPHAVVLGVVGFLTLVDLFATQALLPALAAHYGVSASAMGVAVNATTIGMAVASLVVALSARAFGRRTTISWCLAILVLPTGLLAFAPSLAVFTGLRIAQGLFMATAFTLTIAYVSEQLDAQRTAGALAAYVTGIVASNLVGRLLAASVAAMLGLAGSFFVFAGLNLVGAALVARSFGEMRMSSGAPMAMASLVGEVHAALSVRSLRVAFAIGFLILFAFIGTFTYVNFVLVRPPVSISQMSLGLIYLVFAPSLVTTPLTGRFVKWFGPGVTATGALVAAAAGLPLLASSAVGSVLAGMTLMAVGTFMAQAVATGFVAARAPGNRAVASGLYLASYYLGGLAGAYVLGRIFDGLGWTSCLEGIGVALVAAALLAVGLRSK